MKKQFYELFKFGMEFEMEVPEERVPVLQEIGNELNGKKHYLSFQRDGSITPTKPNTFMTELITSKPIVSQEEEANFITGMKHVLPNFKSQANEDIFAFQNKTCGTHFHWSFKEHGDHLLSIFDCIEFEKFFFNRYMEEFKSEKFLSRINTKYCKAPYLVSADGLATKPHNIKKDLSKIKITHYSNEERDADGRYRWLNMQSVREGTGAEIRVFPYLQTHAGVAQTIAFMQKTILDFYLQPQTQERIMLIELFEEKIKSNEIRSHLLNDLKHLMYSRIIEIRKEHWSGEVKMLLSRWVLKQPSLIKQEKAS